MTRYLVTGGAGFIGSHLCERLIAMGHQVIALDDFSTGDRDNLADIADNERFQLVEGEAEADILEDLVPAADIVFHLAATVGVFSVVDSPRRTMENNIDTTSALLRAAAVRRTKVVLASTSEVYGKSTAIPLIEDGDVVLGPTVRSRWCYAASKMVDEFLALAFWQEQRVPTVVARLFNTIGPRQVGNYGMVVPRLLTQALEGEDLTVFGDGRQSRCFTYVSDVVEWLIRLADSDRTVGSVLNLGNPREITILDLARKIRQLTTAQGSIVFVPYEKAYEAGYEDMRRRVPDISKVVRITGYKPGVDLDTALARIRDWLVCRRPCPDRAPEAETTPLTVSAAT